MQIALQANASHEKFLDFYTTIADVLAIHSVLLADFVAPEFEIYRFGRLIHATTDYRIEEIIESQTKTAERAMTIARGFHRVITFAHYFMSFHSVM